MSNQAYVRAHTNIALIKYWGKRDEIDFLPMNSSLSMTLDKLYTDTMVVFDDSFAQDSFYLNGEKQGEKETKKISKFLDLFREEKKDSHACARREHQPCPYRSRLGILRVRLRCFGRSCQLSFGT